MGKFKREMGIFEVYNSYAGERCTYLVVAWQHVHMAVTVGSPAYVDILFLQHGMAGIVKNKSDLTKALGGQ